MSDDPYKHLDERIQKVDRIVGLVLVVVVLAFFAAWLGLGRGCSTAPKDKTETVTVVTTSTSTGTGTDTGGTAPCGALDHDETKREACPVGDGYKEWRCNNGRLVLEHDDCQLNGGGECRVPFSAVEDTLNGACVSCHTGYATYATAKQKAGEFLRRIELPTSQSQHMPKGGDLTPAKKDAFRAWVEGGACEGDTEPQPQRPFTTWDKVESAAFDDLADKDEDEREETRWLYSVHRLNAQASEAEARAYHETVVKAINSVSRERRQADAEEVAPGVYRIELDELGWDEKEWDLVERVDPFNIESFTAKGLALKQLTKAKKPIMSVEAFVQAALADAPTYRTLSEIPETFDAYMAKKGVDFKDDQKDGKVLMAAFVGSPLSPHNRMVAMFESDDGHCTVTFDTGPTDTPQKNFFAFPLLPDVGGKLNAQFVAGESICDKGNGLHEYALWNAKDTVVQGKFLRSDLNVALNAADVGVVIDYRASQKGLSAVISPGISCFACHATGMIPFRDQVRGQVLRNGSEFGTDKDLILKVYRDQRQWDSFFASANASYGRALTEIGAAPRGEDPITVVQDATRGAWDLGRLAAFLVVPTEDFRVLLNQSANGRAQVGQLLDGGTITFDQVVQTLPLLIRDLRLFQDPL